MRTEKSIKNAISAIVSNGIAIIVSFIAQAFFVRLLGKEYNGLNGLFSNIISMLSVVELGLGSALVYHLYEPLAKNDKKKIKSIMRFYRNSYRIVALIIIILSVAMLPFLNLFVNTNLDINIYLVFLLFAVESSSSYLLSYKRSILYADQKSYILNIIKIGYTILLNTLQVTFLLFTKNYYLYLIIKIAARIIENLVITTIANKKYSYLRTGNTVPLDNKTKKSITKKVKGLLFHKIGSYIVLGTDNIIISSFINLGTVGIYANYTLITNGINAIFSQVFYSITAGIGNLLTEKRPEKSYKSYKEILLINFWITCFSCIAFYLISKPFVEMWVGPEYVLTKDITLVIMINLYLNMYGYTIGAFKTASGIFHEDRFVPILQSVTNIIVSIALVIPFGLMGVIIGTIASTLILYLYSYPHFVYTKLFNRKKISYYLEFFKYIVIFAIIFTVSVLAYNAITIHVDQESVIFRLIIAACVSLLLPNIMLLVMFKNTPQFEIFKTITKTIKTK